MTVRSWRIDSLTVECTLDVVQQISAAVRDGFMRFPHGGLEIGGVLIGEGRGDVLRITGTRPIPIEYARGASFELPDADKSNLRLPMWWAGTSRTREEVQCSLTETKGYTKNSSVMPDRCALLLSPLSTAQKRGRCMFAI